MADAIASPLLRSLIEKSSSLEGAAGFRSLKKLRDMLAEIQPLVVDAEKVLEENESVKLWLREVKDAAYDADDILDQLLFLISKKKVCNLTSLWKNPLVLRSRTERKVKEIGERFIRLCRSMISFYVAKTIVVEEGSKGKLLTNSFVDESEVYGRGVEKKMVLNSAIGCDMDQQLSVIPIVGMGGLGKTTLAQLVYNDMVVRMHFDLRAWVHVGDVFNVSMIARRILESATEISCDLSNMDVLERRLKSILDQKRYLIVLDDVWNESHVKWDTLREMLNSGAQGCVIIVTARSERVTAIMGGTIPPIRLMPLSNDDCWSLFRHRAFLFQGEEEENPKLVQISKEIVKKCQGVPLAAKTLGGLMRSKRDESMWQLIKDDLLEYESDIIPCLKLSYHHLPLHLKQCFAYCSLFPKGCLINKEKLIQLWIAQGFIHSSRRSGKLEDIGNDYFRDLLSRSLLIDVEIDDYGEVIHCKMHGLIHDLARSISRTECLIMEAGAVMSVSEKFRHSSLVYDSSVLKMPEPLHGVRSLRTLLVRSANLQEIPHNMFLNYRFLRALDLSRSGIRKLSNSVGTLIHLRYLDLSQTSIEVLPKSITGLQNLQTLKLSECYCFRELPKDIKEMTNLRHLDIWSCCSLSHMPSGIGQ